MTWENDDRGKPCKWLKTITIDATDLQSRSGEHQIKVAEIDAAFKQCWADYNELMASNEYVGIVAPEIHERGYVAADDHHVFDVRARVRWVTPEAKANRERNLAAMFDAADDEFEKVMTERAGGPPN